MALNIFENLTQEELEEFIAVFGKSSQKSEKKSARGVWSAAANPDLIPLEEGAWERAVVERYGGENEDT